MVDKQRVSQRSGLTTWAKAAVALSRLCPGLGQAPKFTTWLEVDVVRGEIGRMRELRFARLVPAESNRGYQYLMSMVFEDEAGLANYMDHELHRELYLWAKERECEFLYFDYDLEDATLVRQP